MRSLLVALVASAATIIPHAPASQAPGTSPVLPPFAATLAQMPAITSVEGWHGDIGDAAWAKLAVAKPETRQLTRWNYALGLLGEGRGSDALGVLDIMALGDDDLALVSTYQLARGAALTLLGRDAEAVQALGTGDLVTNPEACAWRMRALAHAGSANDAVQQINCAIPAINGRKPAARAPFVLAAAGAAIDDGQPQPALAWLKLFPDRDPDANVLRGRALIATGDAQGGRLRLERAAKSGNPEDVAEARLAMIESQIGANTLGAASAAKQLDALRYGWRGGRIEERALRLQLKLALAAHDLRGQLQAGATLFRYFKLGAEAGPMLATLQTTLAGALAPETGLSLPDAAGIYWDYRELAPSGPEGDALALRLADRLESASLYGRAAELLQYQLTQRRQDVAQGPLSAKVAALHILAGHPERALDVIRTTEQPSYSDGMRQERKRIEAVALHRMGKDEAAMAALEGLPDATALRAEIHWRSQDWGAFVTENEPRLPAAKGLSEPGQAAVLRQAVALGMLAREDKLAALRTRYGAAFKTLPSGQAFEVLTGKPGAVDPATLSAAMAAIPEASPAGSIGDLLDAEG
ncbi:hypothetical protein AB2M62_02115 [Sphingomonas sp. MMS12-HWE2-04]|uniref:hypothetical protein n=1 Tax=Sphingomonas sp. MMS12-HWE2-04 TaxID=3234199 RepID=UPI00384DE5AC